MQEKRAPLTFYEFFAGGGMARLGLGQGWRCLFANDWCPKKAAAHRENFRGDDFVLADVTKLRAADLPGRADLAWSSFPCQDLSLAGQGAGLRGARSGAFWPFWRLIEALVAEGRGPRAVVLENVVGALTSHGGHDLRAIAEAVTKAGYRLGALVIDAVLFVPQSRPRLFLVAVAADEAIPPGLRAANPDPRWQPERLTRAVAQLPPRMQQKWIWWRLPAPPPRAAVLPDLIERDSRDVKWRSAAETDRLLAQMTETNLAKLRAAQERGDVAVGCVYRRMRRENGVKVQRAEARFDGVAGCLRTPAGGSSRQFLLVAEHGVIRSRLLSARETARLMGVPDSYRLPANYNAAYHLMGDAVVPPAVSWLERHLLRPLLAG